MTDGDGFGAGRQRLTGRSRQFEVIGIGRPDGHVMVVVAALIVPMPEVVAGMGRLNRSVVMVVVSPLDRSLVTRGARRRRRPGMAAGRRLTCDPLQRARED